MNYPWHDIRTSTAVMTSTNSTDANNIMKWNSTNHSPLQTPFYNLQMAFI